MPIVPGTPGVLKLSRLIASVYDVHQANNFRVKFFFPERAGSLPQGKTFADLLASYGSLQVGGDSRVYAGVIKQLSGFVPVPLEASFNPPDMQLETRSTRRGNRLKQYAGWLTTGTASLGIHAFVDTPYYAFFHAWIETCAGIGKDKASVNLDIAKMVPSALNAGEKSGIRSVSPKAYKADVVVEKLGPDGSLVGVWVLQGVWPVRFSSDTLNNSSSGEALKVSVDFSVDACRSVL